MKVHFVVLLLHWGGRVEGGYYPDREQKIQARKLIDNGADLIIGHHTHTLQPYEKYKGKYIYYSLGNFCFADYQTDGIIKHLDKRRRTDSIILQAEFRADNTYKVNMVPIKNKDLIITKNPNGLKKNKIRNVLWKMIFSKKLFWNLYILNLKTVVPITSYLLQSSIPFSEKRKKISSYLLHR